MRISSLIYIILFAIGLCRGQETERISIDSIVNVDSTIFPEIEYFHDAFSGSNKEFVIDTIIPDIPYYKIKDKLFNYKQYSLIQEHNGFVLCKTEYDWATTYSDLFYLKRNKNGAYQKHHVSQKKILKNCLNHKAYRMYIKHSEFISYPLIITYNYTNKSFVIKAFEEPYYIFYDLNLENKRYIMETILAGINNSIFEIKFKNIRSYCVSESNIDQFNMYYDLGK